MHVPSVVIIGRSEHTASLRNRLNSHPDVAVFSDAEAWGVFQEILDRPPKILALDAMFATTARAAALVARLKADSHLTTIDLRVLIEDEEHVPLALAQQLNSPETTLLQTSRPLDRCGTRRAVRFPMNRRVVVVNGDKSQLVDLSVTGAQVLVPMRLRPAQPLRITLMDGSTETRCQGHVAWSIAVPTGATVQYRAGVEFLNPDAQVLEAFCVRYGGHPDRTFGAA